MRIVRLKRRLILLALAMFLAACTTTRQLPRQEFAAAEKGAFTMFIVSTSDDQVYRVRSYTVIDSMFIIDELTTKDTRHDTALMPIAVPLSNISSVEMRNSDRGAFLFLVPVVLVTVFLYSLTQISID